MPKFDVEGLYRVPQDYEALWGASGEDWPWYQAHVRGAQRVLDLATGTGRLALMVARLGAEVCAIDSSEAMLAVARARGAEAGLSVDWRLADLRSLNLGQPFDLALLPYNGLQHLCVAEDLDGFLAGLKNSLAAGGRFALDLHLPRPEILGRDPEEWFGVMDSGTSPTGWRVLAEQSRWDPALQVLTQRWRLGNEDGGQRILELPLRQFFPQELGRLLQQAGFQLLEHWGGFQSQPLDAGSLKQVILARRIG